MRINYLAKLAIKNIWAHKLRSFLTMSGIAIGVGFIVFLISLGAGLQKISTQEIAHIDALQVIDVTPGKSKVIEINDSSVAKLKKVSNVTDAEPQVNVVANISVGSSLAEGVVYGKNKEYLELEKPELEQGVLYTSNLEKQVLINKSLAKQLGLLESPVGKTLKAKIIIPADIKSKTAKEATIEENFKIVGLLKNESSPYAYIPLQAFKEYGVQNYSAVKVRVSDKKYSDLAKQEIESLGYKTTSLKNTVDQINQFFTIFQLILLSFGAIAIIIAALGMFNTLTISLLEKTREISFMKVMGTSRKDIWRLFLSEALIIGTLGATFGILGGTFLGESLNNFLIGAAQKTGNRPVEIFYTPTYLLIVSFGATLIISLLTGIYPSFRASRIDALESLRYE